MEVWLLLWQSCEDILRLSLYEFGITGTGLAITLHNSRACRALSLSWLALMPRWPPSTSNTPSSTASGTTPSHQTLIRQITRVFRDVSLAYSSPEAVQHPEPPHRTMGGASV